MQEYVYKFSYDSDGGVTVNLTTNGKPTDKGKKKPVSIRAEPMHAGYTAALVVCFSLAESMNLLLVLQKANVSSVKYQVCRLIRMLVHICKTLDSRVLLRMQQHIIVRIA